MDLNDTVALVTGAASGLGAASAEAIIAGGGKVALLDLDGDRGRETVANLGDAAIFVETNVTDEASVTAARDAALSKFGKITAVVNCAGIALASKTVGKDGAHDLGMFQRTIDINLVGSFNVARLAAEAIASNTPNDEGERGVIIHTASIAAFEGQRGQPAYAASKGGVAALTLPMARDMGDLGIRVMAIAPGLFMTPMLAGLPDAAQEALASQPLFPKRLGRPEEFGKMVRFIIESPYLNGTSIRIDGGIRLP
ncbi:SDR family NAD(P)-dependent oxidoreductase [Litoreibacter roseus]|uniref:3-hydroxy-2-methylbutyryl-CoA dehydrogenase n=1 Tax=Litoreibacter roseus TaxID=2601869 RepID=A0A6N6JE40_9RHOB|nr:SDR family NAD(P)-dependent oxidoreductase [Litoreibacter roseus]GFE64237.1 3-hydroxy-2-methylbutyryl-CoA dehydrogenase [Litoreibacter roseus]